MGGLIWAYLGPDPAPLLPRYDLFVRDDVEREIGITRLPCNWLQIMENSLDPVHLEYLHSVYMNYVHRKSGRPAPTRTRHHERIAFDVFRYGITKRRLWVGESEDATEWTVGHPILFPNILSVGDPAQPQFQIRVPADDTHTYHVWYRCKTRPSDHPPQSSHDIPVLDYAYREEDGRLIVDTVSGQDMMVWVTQGDISDRTTERLGSTDQGVILYRNLLDENIRKVEQGEEPMAVIRDLAENTPMVQVHRETVAFRVSGPNTDLFAARRELGTRRARDDQRPDARAQDRDDRHRCWRRRNPASHGGDGQHRPGGRRGRGARDAGALPATLPGDHDVYLSGGAVPGPGTSRRSGSHRRTGSTRSTPFWRPTTASTSWSKSPWPSRSRRPSRCATRRRKTA